jgi:hypothetical protein
MSHDRAFRVCGKDASRSIGYKYRRETIHVNGGTPPATGAGKASRLGFSEIFRSGALTLSKA